MTLSCSGCVTVRLRPIRCSVLLDVPLVYVLGDFTVQVELSFLISLINFNYLICQPRLSLYPFQSDHIIPQVKSPCPFLKPAVVCVFPSHQHFGINGDLRALPISSASWPTAPEPSYWDWQPDFTHMLQESSVFSNMRNFFFRE